MKFMISCGIASVAQSQFGAASGVPSIAIPETTAVLVIQTPKKGVTAQQIMALIPAEIPVTVNLHLDGKNRQWYSRGEAKASSSWSTRRSRTRLEPLMETLPLAKEQLMDREYIPVGPLMALRALMGARARQ